MAGRLSYRALSKYGGRDALPPVPAEKFAFPDIPGVRYTGIHSELHIKDFRANVQAAARELVSQRFLLPDDANGVIEEAKRRDLDL